MNEKKIKVLDRSTEKKSFLKRVTHIKIDLNGNVIEEKIEHYAKPIDALIAILEYFWIGRIEIKIQDKVIKRWKFPFQSMDTVFASVLDEAFSIVKEEKEGLIKNARREQNKK